MAKTLLKLQRVQLIKSVRLPDQSTNDYAQVQSNNRQTWQIVLDVDAGHVTISDSKGTVYVPLANVAAYYLLEAA